MIFRPRLAVNTAHWAHSALEFAYNGNASRIPRNIASRAGETLTRVSTTELARVGAGWGVKSDAADRAFYAPAQRIAALGGNVTLLWRGVLLGAAGTSNTSPLFGVFVGDGMSSPIAVAALSRTNFGANGQSSLRFLTNNGGTGNSVSDANIGLTGYYGRVITLAVSSQVGSFLLNGWASFGGGPIKLTLPNVNVQVGNPRTTTTARYYIGSAFGATSFPNAICIGAAAWHRAFSDAQMRDIVGNLDEVFTPPKRDFVAFSRGLLDEPDIEITGNGNAVVHESGTPTPGNRTHFGAVPLGGAGRSHTFVVANNGAATLSISDTSVATGFTITTDLAATIAVASSDDLVVRLDASVAGTVTGDMVVSSDSPTETTIRAAIKGTVYPPAPAPFTYPTFPAPGAVEDTQTISGTPYDFLDGGVYATGPTGPLLDTIYPFHFYWDNYLVEGGVLYRIAAPVNVAVNATMFEDFEGAATLPALIGPVRGWSQVALQEDAAPDGAAAIALGNQAIAQGASAFITNRVEPSTLRANGGAQSLRVYCQGGTVTAPITKASIATGLLHFAEGEDIWLQFFVYIEDGTPLGLLDVECSYQLNSPGMRLLLNTSFVPRIQLKWNANPDLDGSNPIPTDQWVKIRIHLGLSSATDGVVQMWVDDALEIDGTMQTMPLPSSVYDRVQIGVTANTEAAAALVYFDDLKVARSEAALDGVATVNFRPGLAGGFSSGLSGGLEE